EQDTRLTLRQPLYAPAIPAAVNAQRSLLEGAQFARIAVARRLKRDVTVSYLDWLRASKTVDIVESSATLLRENLRVNESLFRNGKITQDQVLRARAELLEVEQQVREAQNLRDQARSFVNFLLNRPLETPLTPAEMGGEVSRATADLATLRAAALANRPEIEQSERGVRAAQSQVRIERADLKPTVSLGVDGGIQGEEYEFGRGRNFSMVSLLLNWQFFDGGTNRAQVRGARAAARQAEVRRDEVVQQIQLEVQQALDRLTTTSDSLATAEARAEAARAGFRIASRKRDEGVINQVEFIDARSALTGAELNLNVTVFNLLARQAELDYATVAGKLPLPEV
ncbi:MAG TPA: TolC family protein, partial [Steroidobacteraceae bacterium]|nr:TolC family protein [Steroidobacteraceae bacterium]